MSVKEKHFSNQGTNNKLRGSGKLNNGVQNCIEVKSKFDSEFRRFSLPRQHGLPDIEQFWQLIESLHHLKSMPFTLCYTDAHGDLLPINNDDNFRKALESARPILRLLVSIY